MFLLSFGAPTSRHNECGKGSLSSRKSALFHCPEADKSAASRGGASDLSAAKLDGARAEPAVAALFPGNCLRLMMPIASRHWTKQWGSALCHSSLAPRTDQRVGSQRPAVLRGSGRRVGTTQARQGAPLLATTHGEAPIPIMRWPEQQISFKDVSFAITTWPPVGPKLVPNLALDVPSSLSLGLPLWLRW